MYIGNRFILGTKFCQNVNRIGFGQRQVFAPRIYPCSVSTLLSLYNNFPFHIFSHQNASFSKACLCSWLIQLKFSCWNCLQVDSEFLMVHVFFVQQKIAFVMITGGHDHFSSSSIKIQFKAWGKHEIYIYLDSSTEVESFGSFSSFSSWNMRRSWKKSWP